MIAIRNSLIDNNSSKPKMYPGLHCERYQWEKNDRDVFWSSKVYNLFTEPGRKGKLNIHCGGAKNNFLPTFLSPLAGLIIKSTWDGLTGENVQHGLRMYIFGLHETRSNWAIAVYMPFWAKAREAGGWDFKERAGNLQVDEKEKTRGEGILAGPPRNTGTHKEVLQTGFARLHPVCHIWFILC